MSAPRPSGRWYRRVVVPLLVLAALAGIYLLVLSGLGHMALGAFLVDNDAATTRAATAMSRIGALERYRGPFAEGTAAAAQAEDRAELAEAEELLREALALADPTGECAVRHNLALVLEAAAQDVEKGEQPDAAQAAEAGYREAAAVAAGAPAECADVPSGLEATTSSSAEEQRWAADDLEAAATRTTAAAEAAAQEGEDSGEGDEQPEAEREPGREQPTAPSDRQTELNKRMGQAQETEQQLSESGGGEGAVGDGAAEVSAPW